MVTLAAQPVWANIPETLTGGAGVISFLGLLWTLVDILSRRVGARFEVVTPATRKIKLMINRVTPGTISQMVGRHWVDVELTELMAHEGLTVENFIDALRGPVEAHGDHAELLEDARMRLAGHLEVSTQKGAKLLQG